MDRLEKYIQETAALSPQELLVWGLETFGRDRIILASAFGAESQVITSMIADVDKSMRIFTIDTGRLFPETYDLWQRTRDKYGVSYEVLTPNSDALQALVEYKGPNLFRNSVEDRKSCCEVRKMQPLRKVLTTVDCWITGVRRSQSITRKRMNRVEFDTNFGIYKLNPLVEWSEEQVWAYIKEHDVPYNELHDKGYPSIGCQPCTRAVEPGEDIRSGRWWWEEPEQKECGLHFKDGKLVRKTDD